MRKATRSYRTYSSLVKLQPWFLSLRWKICLWAELQPRFVSLQWRTCPRAEHMMMMMMMIMTLIPLPPCLLNFHRCSDCFTIVALPRWDPWDLSDILSSVPMLKKECGAESNGKLPHLFIHSKLQPRFLSLQWKTCLWTELQPWCLSLQWKTCPWAEHSADDDHYNGKHAVTLFCFLSAATFC